MSRYVKIRQLSRDSSTTVYLAEDRLHRGRFYEWKSFKISPRSCQRETRAATDMQPLRHRFRLLELLTRLTELRHPYCSRYFHVYVEDGVLSVLTEHGNLGRLDRVVGTCLEKKSQCDEMSVLRWSAQIVLAALFLASNDIILTQLPFNAVSLSGCPSNACAKIVDVESNCHVLEAFTFRGSSASNHFVKSLGLMLSSLLLLGAKGTVAQPPSSPLLQNSISVETRSLIKRMTENTTVIDGVEVYSNILHELALHPVLQKHVRQVLLQIPELPRLHPRLANLLLTRSCIPRCIGTNSWPLFHHLDVTFSGGHQAHNEGSKNGSTFSTGTLSTASEKNFVSPQKKHISAAQIATCLNIGTPFANTEKPLELFSSDQSFGTTTPLTQKVEPTPDPFPDSTPDFAHRTIERSLEECIVPSTSRRNSIIPKEHKECVVRSTVSSRAHEAPPELKTKVRQKIEMKRQGSVPHFSCLPSSENLLLRAT